MKENVEEESEDELEATFYDPGVNEDNEELGKKVKEEVGESEHKFKESKVEELEEGVKKVEDELYAASEAKLNEAASGLILAILRPSFSRLLRPFEELLTDPV